MRSILDASVGAQCLLVEKDSVKARRLRDDFNNGVHELLAPDVFPIEVLNVLTKAERRGRITPGGGTLLADACLNSLPILHDSLPLLPRAYELSSLTRSAVYDRRYVALAEREGCDLVTAEENRVNNLTGYPVLLLSAL